MVRKHFLSMIMLVLAVCNAQAYTFEDDTLAYEKKSNRYYAEITGLSSKYNKSKALHLFIPDSVADNNGTKLPVMSIQSEAFKDQSCLRSVTMHKTKSKLKTIEENAFNGCSNLDSIALSQSCDAPTAEVFSGCKLKRVRITNDYHLTPASYLWNWSTIFPDVEYLYLEDQDKLGKEIFYYTNKSTLDLHLYLKDGCVLWDKSFYGRKNVYVHGKPSILYQEPFGTDDKDCMLDIDLSETEEIYAFNKCASVSHNGVIDLRNVKQMLSNAFNSCKYSSSPIKLHVQEGFISYENFAHLNISEVHLYPT